MSTDAASKLPNVFDDRWSEFERDGTGPWIRRTCKDGYQFGVASENGKGQIFWLSKRRADGKGIDYQSRVIGQGEAWNRANDYAEKHGGWVTTRCERCAQLEAGIDKARAVAYGMMTGALPPSSGTADEVLRHLDEALDPSRALSHEEAPR